MANLRQFNPLCRLPIESVVLVAAILGVLLFQALPGPRPLDDASITYRYARNLSYGNGLVYNPGEYIQGSTTPLYTLLLALLGSLLGAAAIPVGSFVLALAADVINTWLLFRIARRLLRHDLAALALALVFLLQPLRLNVAGGGMETSLLITCLLAMLDAYLAGGRLYLTALFAALAVLIRLDAALAVIPVLAHALWKYRLRAIPPILLGLLLLVPWFTWAAWYFGSPIPHSILAKMAAYHDSSPAAALIFLFTFLGTGTVGPYHNLWLVLPGLIGAVFLLILGLIWSIREGHELLLVSAYPLLYALVMASQHAPMFFTWYYLPLMPGLLLLFFAGLLKLSRSLGAKQQRLIITLASAALLLTPALLMHWLPGWADTREIEGLYHQASVQAKPLLRPGDWVLAPDIGTIGWDLDQARILDPIGLVSPISLSYLPQRQPDELVSLQLVRDLQPAVIIARDDFIKNLLADPQFRADYRIVWQKPAQHLAPARVLILQHR